MRAIEWANVADSDLIYRGISFRYRWEPARQDNISRVYLHLSTKLSKNVQNDKKEYFEGGCRWFQVVVGGFRWL